MKKIIRLTESDLIKIIKRAINEEHQEIGAGFDSGYEFIPHWSDSISPKEMERLEKKFRDEDEEERNFPKERIIDVKSTGSKIFIYGDTYDANIQSFSSKNAYDINSGVALDNRGEGDRQIGLVDYIKYVIQKWNEYYSRNNRPNPKIIFRFFDDKLMNLLSNYYDKNNIPKPEFHLISKYY